MQRVLRQTAFCRALASVMSPSPFRGRGLVRQISVAQSIWLFVYRDPHCSIRERPMLSAMQ